MRSSTSCLLLCCKCLTLFFNGVATTFAQAALVVPRLSQTFLVHYLYHKVYAHRDQGHAASKGPVPIPRRWSYCKLCFALQVDEAMKMNTTDNVSVITICLTAAAPPKRTFSGHVSVQRTLSHEGLNRLGSAIMSADDSRTGM